MVSHADVLEAQQRIRGRVRRTPCMSVRVPLPRGSSVDFGREVGGIDFGREVGGIDFGREVGGIDVVLKLELLQVTGSFKPRGAMNSLLASGAPEVVACSGGNHGLAVAWAAAELGRKATIVVPVSAAKAKVDAMRLTGAEVIQHGDVPAEAFAVAERICAERGLPLIHPYNQEPTIAGQGTLALELLEQAPEVTHWLVAVGGGGFPAGVVIGFDGHAEVVCVEPELCPSLYEAQRNGGPIPTRTEGIARTSLGPPSLGELAWDALRDTVAPCTLVTDAQIEDAQRSLWTEARLVAEPGGATSLAALLSGAWVPPSGARVGVIVCGGNADSLPV